MRCILAFTILSLLSAPASSGEVDLRLDRGIAATATYPEGEGPFPGVLLLHGLGSSRDEAGNIFADAATGLADRGYASLRIDFRGFGQSPGDTGAFTLTRQLEDARIALSALTALSAVDESRLGVIGFSFGAGAAIELAAAAPDQVHALALWAPVGDYRADVLESFGARVFERAESDGIAAVDLGWRTLAFRRAFFDELAGPDLQALLHGFSGAALLVNGAEDPYLRYAEPYLASPGGPRRHYIVEGADHIFNAYKAGTSRVPEVIGATADYFNEVLSPSPQNTASP